MVVSDATVLGRRTRRFLGVLMSSRKAPKRRRQGREWIVLRPNLVADATANAAFRRTARRLTRAGTNGTSAQTIAAIREQETLLAQNQGTAWAAELILVINVLCDLRAQGWSLRIRPRSVAALPPLTNGDSVAQ